MNVFQNIIGNEELCARLALNIRENSLSHAYIIEGPDGCGKHTLARELAAALGCENRGDSAAPLPCGVCKSCRMILGEKSADVITVRREAGKAQLGVDIIRDLKNDVRLLPNDLDIKVYIIEDAHTMNIQAQNAFLLTLEEPPAFVVFFLLCTSSALLLETIKSRAQTLRLRPLSDRLLREELIKRNDEASELYRSSKSEFEEIIKLSGGCMGRSLQLLDINKRTPKLAARHLVKDFIYALSMRKSGRRSIDLINSFSKNREELGAELSDIQNAARDLLAVKKCEGAPLCFFTSEDEAAEISFKFKTADLVSLIESADAARSRLAANSNIRLTVYSFAIDCKLL